MPYPLFLSATVTLVLTGATAAQPLALQTVTRSLSEPVAIIAGPPAGPDGHLKLYVAQRPGQVRLVDTVTGEIAPAVVLTPSMPVSVAIDGGLQCIAVDPASPPSARHIYLYYNIATTTAVLERQTLNAQGTAALPGSALTILRYNRAPGHNGGWLGFSPVDHHLYLSLGDGGFATDPDPLNAAQTLTGPDAFHGKVLRLDPTGDDFPTDPDRNYRIPAGNPFSEPSSPAGEDEIWDYGLRNPWRCTFDSATGDFYIADVGQETWEEINIERVGLASGLGGHNYGWKCFEGPTFTGYAPCAAPIPFTPPSLTYGHGEGCSITGGIVYRGSALPWLTGAYLFSDYCNPALWALTTPSGDPVRTTLDSTGTTAQEDDVSFVVAFGADETGEVYFASYITGLLCKLAPGPCPADMGGPGGVAGHDGQLSNNDFVVFIDYFFTADPRANIGCTGGLPGFDGVFNNNDFIVFIDAFFTGC